MRLMCACTALLLSVSLGLAAERPVKIMRIGKDTQSFHIPVGKSEIYVYAPHEDFVKRLVQLMQSVMGDKEANFQLQFGEIRNANNAYAVVHQGKRYMLADADMWGRAGVGALGEAVLYGHELGHHVCGHVGGGWTGRAWDAELEADQFGGAAIRAYLEDGYGDKDQAVTHGEMLETVSHIFLASGGSTGSATHPPLNLRLQAFSRGWNESSPCLKNLR